jgi:hypothetical protein
MTRVDSHPTQQVVMEASAPVVDKEIVNNAVVDKEVDNKWVQIVKRGDKEYARYAWRDASGKIVTKGIGPRESLTPEQVSLIGSRPKNTTGLKK